MMINNEIMYNKCLALVERYIDLHPEEGSKADYLFKQLRDWIIEYEKKHIQL